MVHCDDATAGSFVIKAWVKSSNIFTQLPQNATIVCGIDCLACQDEFFENNLLDVKENYEHAVVLALHISHFFGLSEFWTYVYGSCFLL
jgi:hypothetical protein